MLSFKKPRALPVAVMGLLLMLGISLFCPGVAAAGEQEIKNAVALLEKGEKQQDHESLSRAEKLLEKECSSPSPDPLCDYYLARVYLAQYTYYSQVKPDRDRASSYLSRAEASARAAVARDPKSASAHVILGKIYQLKLVNNPLPGLTRALVDESPVVQEFTRALELDPHNGEAEMGLGIYYLFIPRVLGGDGHRARNHFHQASKLMPRNPEPLVWISISYREEGRLDEAREYIDKALAMDPSNSFARKEEARLRAEEAGR